MSTEALALYEQRTRAMRNNVRNALAHGGKPKPYSLNTKPREASPGGRQQCTDHDYGLRYVANSCDVQQFTDHDYGIISSTSELYLVPQAKFLSVCYPLQSFFFWR